MARYTASLIIFILFGPGSAYSQALNLDIRLFSDQQFTSFTIHAAAGSYTVRSGKTEVLRISAGTTARITLEGGGIRCGGNKVLRQGPLIIRKTGNSGYMRLKVNGEERRYDGRLIISVGNGRLWLINHVPLENYVAGVVESEGGDGSHTEFYKVQSLISRTYAIKNMRKHEAEGYHLCDQVHCQLYLGRSRHREINEAVSATKGKVIVDGQGMLISAAFHSNSGGETVSSENVWTYSLPYLNSIRDSFSIDMPKYRWQKKITADSMIRHLKHKYDYPVTDPVMRDSALNFSQEKRLLLFPGRIPLKNIRADLELRSTFFDLRKEGDSIVISGKGFGHGIGLSQEGAINMSRKGYSYIDILNFYYRNIKITSFVPAMVPKKPAESNPGRPKTK